MAPSRHFQTVTSASLGLRGTLLLEGHPHPHSLTLSLRLIGPVCLPAATTQLHTVHPPQPIPAANCSENRTWDFHISCPEHCYPNCCSAFCFTITFLGTPPDHPGPPTALSWALAPLCNCLSLFDPLQTELPTAYSPLTAELAQCSPFAL